MTELCTIRGVSLHVLGALRSGRVFRCRSLVCALTLWLWLQEFKERTESVRKLKEEYGDASTGLQKLTAAVEEKKVRNCLLT